MMARKVAHPILETHLQLITDLKQTVIGLFAILYIKKYDNLGIGIGHIQTKKRTKNRSSFWVIKSRV